MKFIVAVASVALQVTDVQAQGALDPPCQSSVSRQIAFASRTAKDSLTVSIGPGACHSATLSIVVTSSRGKVLYRYVALFKKHVATQWDDPERPQLARDFLNETASHALVSKGDRPVPKPADQAEEGDAVLTVPAPVFARLASRGQPMLYHPTYYEGGQYVVYDPATRTARVVAQWGV